MDSSKDILKKNIFLSTGVRSCAVSTPETSHQQHITSPKSGSPLRRVPAQLDLQALVVAASGHQDHVDGIYEEQPQQGLYQYTVLHPGSKLQSATTKNNGEHEPNNVTNFEPNSTRLNNTANKV